MTSTELSCFTLNVADSAFKYSSTGKSNPLNNPRGEFQFAAEDIERIPVSREHAGGRAEEEREQGGGGTSSGIYVLIKIKNRRSSRTEVALSVFISWRNPATVGSVCLLPSAT